ncbi:MAG TPA: hypothetical protein PKD10_04645 [Paracoccaceae bacterium]|nr:hypothetical protein [Paracoccaceae bacterium]HMO71060.1 hypothetical protein [Paracoccaceae bacterium]
MQPKPNLTDDHAQLHDTLVVRRYFAKFGRIVSYLPRVAGELETEGRLNRAEARAIGGYVQALTRTFGALSLKYLMSGRIDGGAGQLTFDRHESGFPVAQELMVMANDALQADRHLSGMASETELKDRMIRTIVGDLVIPTQLQFAMSQRLYYEALRQGGLFWPRNDPEAAWVSEDRGRRLWRLNWAVWDAQVNLPVVYLMEVHDSGKVALPKDDRRWPAVQAHLMAQSLGGLKLLTIAQGFDADFPNLHPHRLRRLHLGPMYSHAFTVQSGPISEVLAEAAADPGDDWALVWTLEDLIAERAETVRTGWFSSAERQIFALDPFAGRGVDTGATRTERMVILPERPFQVLAERNPPGFRDVRKFVVAANGRVLVQR